MSNKWAGVVRAPVEANPGDITCGRAAKPDAHFNRSGVTARGISGYDGVVPDRARAIEGRSASGK